MLTEKIARFIAQTEYGQIPEDAVKLAKKAILDCIGNCLAGSLTPEGNIILEYIEELGGKTESTVIGGGFKSHIAAISAYASSLERAKLVLTWAASYRRESPGSQESLK